MSFDRNQAEENAKRESAMADMKQHADKLIQGFEKLNDSHAQRAVWELVQNACDLSDKCEIIIDFSNKLFAFTHNGAPFTSNTLISLIKQVSSKTDKEKEIGQFGTGFITTHSFGKKFSIDSVLDATGSFIDIKDFQINRRAKDSIELLNKLVDQQESVYKLIREGSETADTGKHTTFTYIPEHEQEFVNIAQAEKNLHHYVPYVITLNKTLKSVKIIGSDGSIITYHRGIDNPENGLFSTEVIKNNTPFQIYSQGTDDGFTSVILPLANKEQTLKIGDNVAKLFLFFPLIGTEKWGCNFIIHSKNFAPSEARDGIHIKSKNEQTKEKEELNCGIINAASEIVFSFVEKSAETITDPIHLAHIYFDTISNTELINSYYKELKKQWVSNFRKYKLVQTGDDRIAPSEATFISAKLLQNEKYFDSIYQILSEFWGKTLPQKQIAKEWTQIVNNWEDPDLQFITVEKLVEQIQAKEGIKDLDEVVLLDVYKYLIEIGEEGVFGRYKLLPNIKRSFIIRDGLVKPLNIDNTFIEIADVIAADIPVKFIKKEYELGLEFNKYRRENLSKDFNTQINTLQKTLSHDNLFSEAFRNKLIDLCCIFPSEGTTSARRRIMPLICSFYKIEYKEAVIPHIEEDKFDYDYTPIRGLVKNFLFDIVKKSQQEKDWVNTNLPFLINCLDIIATHKDFRDLAETIPIFPNQNHKLCLHSELYREEHFNLSAEDSELLKEIYKSIVADIKQSLVLNEFKELLPNKNSKTALELSSLLEQEFKKHPYEKIDDHPNKRIIFQIIQRITDNKEWATLFSDLDSNKALIMMAKISDDEVKNDLFSIIGLEDKSKISMLGRLSKNPNLERIIGLGMKALENEFFDLADFEFKKAIGVHIENLVRKKVQADLTGFEVDVQERQGGQDIIIRLKNEIVYYMEVKSRWNNRNSITMSNLQVKNAVKNKTKYSLCCVEMSDYIPVDGNRYEVKDISLIVDRIRFVNDIGSRIEPLISNAVSAEAREDDVKLTDEYRAVVPQPVVVKGMTFDDFVNSLINQLGLQKIIATDN